MKSFFIISLDFELHWGGFEKWNLNDYQRYFLNTREVIPKILELFNLYGIGATWATVGILFHHSKQELMANLPSLKPSYKKAKLSAYNYLENYGVGQNEKEDPFHFAPSLIRQIAACPNQEVASHTFSHYYCNEAGQTIEEFRADLQAAQKVAVRFGRPLRSLVFPRNQFNDDYLQVCFEEGITSVRSNPLDWFWNIQSTQSESKWKRINRGLDAYLPIGKENTYKLTSLEIRKGFPVSIPASRLLRPYNPKELFLNRMKINRIKSEMERAAVKAEVYHLWWHPHNFGNFPSESMKGLEEILEHYNQCRDKYGMESLTMNEITELVLNQSM